MHKMKTCLMLLALAATLACSAATTSIEDAQTSFFATVSGTDADCEGWLEWCIAQGYPQDACDERNEYCDDGRWVGGDREDNESSDDPCRPAAEAAYNDCVDAGGSDMECREAAEEAYEDCAGD
jgi:hypothetical protein